jgi:tetratricopeptide (TPR) repeat protein
MSDATPSRPSADRNLLFGILALQMDFIGRDALIAAMHAWVLDKAKPLGQILVEQGVLHDDTHEVLEALVRKHLDLHDGDAEKSLVSLSSVGSFQKALEQFLADPALQASLAHLSDARSEKADAILTRLTTPFVGANVTRPPSAGASTSSGQRFRILRPHAKGGLGEVFVAHDGELQREVALKEIQEYYADDPQSRARFVLEAEITGGLEHPGIVPVYGLGAYADGRPFYAMRFIRGDSLQDAIARFHAAEKPRRDPGERKVALRELLRHFVDVCNAIAYAHSRGVLHRDLKPGNVMLGNYGETLVVDWGLAKVVGRTNGETAAPEGSLRPVAASATDRTRMGAALGTPAFMPPEQAAGRLDQLGPASDVYSLGATLYCLLTGKAPFESGDVLQRVQRGEFQPPRQVKRKVPAALEAVCLKAMALRPEDRYDNALALAADIKHWLADEPVSAYREPWRIRARRWARRHKPAVAALTAAGVAVLLLGGLGAWWLEREAERRRQGVETSLVEVGRLQKESRWAEARAVLDQAENHLGERGGSDLHERLIRARRELDLVARLDGIRLRKATFVGHEFDTAGADRGYGEAFHEAGPVEVGGDTESAAAWVSNSGVREALVAALDDWASCTEERSRRAWVLEVARLADRGAWRDRLRDPAVWDDKSALALLVNNKGVRELSPQLLAVLGVRLMSLGGDVVRLLRQAQELHPGDFWVNFELGNALKRSNKPDEAARYFQAALAVRPGTLAVHYRLGFLHDAKGEREEAIKEFRTAVTFNPKEALAHVGLGNALKTKGDREEAINEYRTAIKLDSKETLAHVGLGNALIDKGEQGEAIREYRTAIKIDPKDALAHYSLGNALAAKGDQEEAIKEYRTAIQIDPKDAPSHSNLGVALAAKGEREEAIKEYRTAIKIDPKLAQAHNNLGNALSAKGDRKEAIKEFRTAISLDPMDVTAHYNLGNALQEKGEGAEAIKEYRIAIQLNPTLFQAHFNLGVALAAYPFTVRG